MTKKREKVERSPYYHRERILEAAARLGIPRERIARKMKAHSKLATDELDFGIEFKIPPFRGWDHGVVFRAPPYRQLEETLEQWNQRCHDELHKIMDEIAQRAPNPPRT